VATDLLTEEHMTALTALDQGLFTAMAAQLREIAARLDQIALNNHLPQPDVLHLRISISGAAEVVGTLNSAGAKALDFDEKVQTVRAWANALDAPLHLSEPRPPLSGGPGTVRFLTVHAPLAHQATLRLYAGLQFDARGGVA
jgi:hypothetical protein